MADGAAGVAELTNLRVLMDGGCWALGDDVCTTYYGLRAVWAMLQISAPTVCACAMTPDGRRLLCDAFFWKDNGD